MITPKPDNFKVIDLRISSDGVDIKSFTGKIIWESGSISTYLNGYLHSFDDEPASIYDSEEIWYKNSEIHRENGPAEIDNNNGKESYYLFDYPYEKKWYWFLYLNFVKKGLDIPEELVKRFGN